MFKIGKLGYKKSCVMLKQKSFCIGRCEDKVTFSRIFHPLFTNDFFVKAQVNFDPKRLDFAIFILYSLVFTTRSLFFL